MKTVFRRKTKIKLAIILSLIFVLSGFVFFEHKLSQVVDEVALQSVKAKCSTIISKVIYDEIEDSEITYDLLVDFEKDSQNNIAALKINSIEINRLKSSLSLKILSELEKKENINVYIPIGTVFGSKIFSGRGPRIKVGVLPVGSVATDIKNEISTAGINQIRHQIILLVNVQMSVITGMKRLPASVDTNVCIAETVIVGKVPESYTNIDARQEQNKTGEEGINIDPDTLFNFALN